MIKAIIFDLDGTLLYSLPDIHHALRVSFETYQLKPVSLEETRQALGHGVSYLIDTLTKDNQEHIKPLIFDRYLSYYKNHATIHSCPYDGIVDLLKYIKNSKLKIGVASNKGHLIVGRIVNHYFQDFIDAYRGDIEGKPKKPAPDMVYDVIKHLNVYPHEVLYIGDSEPDILVSKHIGLKHIIVSYGYRNKETLLKIEPECIVDTVEQLTHEIVRIIHGSD